MLEFEHVVVGGGLVGAIIALFLKRKSDSVAVFQSYPDLRQQVISEGRSINLVLAKKALDTLRQLGILHQILQNTIQIYGQMIHRSDGSTTPLAYGLTQQDITYCIGRNKLCQCLLDILDLNNVPVFFEHTLINGDIDTNDYVFNVVESESEHQVRVRGKFVYGADGAGSKIRELLLNKMGKKSSTDWFPATYKQLFMPVTPISRDYQLDPNWVHIWPRGGHLMMGHANPNRTFSLTLILPQQGPNSFTEIQKKSKIDEYFTNNYQDVADNIPNVCLQFKDNPIGYLGSINCPIWHYKDKLVLLGDAAHTITPFAWQAVNIGFDDCLQFDRIVDKYGFTEEAFKLYFELQKPKADALSRITLGNFKVLAFLSDDSKFLKQKQTEKQIEKQYPHKFWSKYRLLYFSDKTYREMEVLIKQYEKLAIEWVDKIPPEPNRSSLVLEQQLNQLQDRCI